MPSFTLLPLGWERSKIRRHLFEWWPLLITPKWLICSPEICNRKKGPETLLASISFCRYSDTTALCWIALSRFFHADFNWMDPWTWPILNPSEIPLKKNCTSSWSGYFLKAYSQPDTSSGVCTWQAWSGTEEVTELSIAKVVHCINHSWSESLSVGCILLHDEVSDTWSMCKWNNDINDSCKYVHQPSCKICALPHCVSDFWGCM